MRVPTITGSLVDLTVVLKKDADVKAINNAMKAAKNESFAYEELNADGVHVNDSVLKETYIISKAERIIIVSDSLSPKGLKMENICWDL